MCINLNPIHMRNSHVWVEHEGEQHVLMEAGPRLRSTCAFKRAS